MRFSQLKLLFILLLPFFLLAQKRGVAAMRITGKISIDGRLDEPEWASADTASGFVMFEPDNGRPASEDRKTEVRVLYDDEAVYFGAMLYDSPGLIMKEMALRDDFASADHFGVFINGYNDGQQDFRFFVSAAGTQMDCLATAGGEDYSWDAIWHSEVRMVDNGWIVEIKIPYAAVRFSEDAEQFWGINFYRELRRDRQKYTWNPIDRNIGATIVQTGLLTGITNIKPPVRLFLIPYSSYYYSETANKGTDTQLKGGLDVKYGLTDSFTLDAILVPDFGQTAFDNVVLNLGPFEQQFNENRPFFTEGTDIFNKGGLLYTRRIGGRPTGSIATGEDEEIVEVPQAVNLINAVKLSGRTASGLGIGIMNAITEKTYATLRNTVTGQTRQAVAEPLVNYNVTVLDQRFRQNSSVAFVNTNVTRDGSFRDANVSALVYDLNTRANTFNLSGNFKFSHINDLADRNGYSSSVSIGKTSGKYRYSLSSFYVSKDFDINDLGILFQTNYYNIYARGSYRILNPTKNYNTFQLNTGFYSEFQNDTGKMQVGRFEARVNSNTRKNDYLGYGVEVNPFHTYDFYEPRVDGRFLRNPKSVYSFVYFSSNYNRRFALDVQPELWISSDYNRNYYGLLISPRYRFSNRMLVVYSFNYGLDTNNQGWVGFEGDDIIITRRDRTTVTNTLTGRLAVNPRMTFNLTARHYWTYGENLDFLSLMQDGTLAENTTFNENRDFTFNTWNFDLSYTWWFAPGSQLSVLYRNNASTSYNFVNRNYSYNFENLFKNNLNSIFSISIRYFIDYNTAKNWI
ncbi:hydrolase [Flavobacterium cyanobacteriorum]|uniref:Hydrolase n=1 Tax=Flavobacterium cyanobacteriorum TaxID=2022802 RepID=A0A255YWW1_9FLAO|nr:DUF5916 domain-containing protein [Flavobacterium cyanobacteriorum]OYQ33145.1 hydrolase [Flavobacterium cyanobacteriorum]